MKRKILSALFILLMVCTMLAGCKKQVGTPEDNAVKPVEPEETEDGEEIVGYKVGYSCGEGDDPYYRALELSAKLSVKDSGNTFISKNSEMTVEQQIEQIQTMIDTNVDIVMLCPVDWEKITPALEALREADIPVVNIDTQVKDVNLINAYVGADNRNAGFVCGADLVKQSQEGGGIVILESPAMNTINERITGFEEAISTAEAGFEVLARVDVQGTKSVAKEELQKIMKSNPEIDAIMCGNDQIALGAMEVVKELKRTEIHIYGVGGSPDIKAELAKGNSVIAGTGALSPIDTGRNAVEVAIAILEDDSYEEQTVTESFLIVEDNVELYGTNGWQ